MRSHDAGPDAAAGPDSAAGAPAAVLVDAVVPAGGVMAVVPVEPVVVGHQGTDGGGGVAFGSSAPGPADRECEAASDACRALADRSEVSTTQVSLLPPPWDELTTREPARLATLVKPPRVT